jgi:sigma-B regulation protein RsbU (phosphoserine phosphatase)
VGGDFFDFFLIDKNHLGVVIGGVSGKWTPSTWLWRIPTSEA